MENYRQTKKVMVGALVAFIVSVSLYGLLFALIFEQKSAADALSAATVAQLAQKTQFNSLESTAAETAGSRDKLSSYFIQPDGVVPFLNSLQSLGAADNLAIKMSSVSIGEAATSSSLVEEVRVTVQTAGSWSDTYRFLTLLDLMPMPLFIDDADIEKLSGNAGGLGQKTRGAEEWQGSFTLRALKLK